MPTKRGFTIGQLARAAEIPATTVRYYERIGLLVPDDRSEGNYRLYSQASLQRLRFIRAAQSIGFSLGNVNALLGSRGGQAPSCGEVQALIEERLAEIKRRLKDLYDIERMLKSSLRKCKTGRRAGCCHVVQTLRGNS